MWSQSERLIELPRSDIERRAGHRVETSRIYSVISSSIPSCGGLWIACELIRIGFMKSEPNCRDLKAIRYLKSSCC